MKIGFIGLGLMGESMSENIIKKHDDTVYVYDVAKAKVDEMVSKGGVACSTCKEVGELSDIIISMVPKSEHSVSVYNELLPVLNSNKICIDMSTIEPNVSIEISKKVKSTGAKFLDAPVVKSKAAAIKGMLGIYVGGNEETYKTVLPILLYMGENAKYMGENGKGLVMKICHNMLVAQIQNGVNETIVLAEKNGIDILEYAEAISLGGGQNFYLDSKKSAIKNQDFTTAFSVENMHKDVNICKKMATDQSVTMTGCDVVCDVYDKAMEQGYGKEDFSATIKVVGR